MGLVMENFNLSVLAGLLPGWTVHQSLEQWARAGARKGIHELKKANFVCDTCDGPGKHQSKMENAYGRFAVWFWPPPWKKAPFAFFTGINLGTSYRPVLVQGLPDLVVGIHALGKHPKEDERFVRLRTQAESWLGKEKTGIHREFNPASWEVFRVRQSAIALLEQQDQGAWFADWVGLRVREWVDTGVVSALRALPAAGGGGELTPGEEGASLPGE
jgi:hypothetical protein